MYDFTFYATRSEENGDSHNYFFACWLKANASKMQQEAAKQEQDHGNLRMRKREGRSCEINVNAYVVLGFLICFGTCNAEYVR